MIFLTSDELLICQLLDPATARRLVIGRTGRAFVWDPLASTREVPLAAARALAAQGIVDARGRIAAEHLGLRQQRGTAQRMPAPQPAPQVPAEVDSEDEMPVFDRTLPVGLTHEGLRALG